MTLKANFKNIVLAIFLIFLFVLNVNGQGKSPIYTYSVGANFLNGFIIKHDPKMEALSQTYPNGFEVEVKKSTYGFKLWEEMMNYPEMNFALTYMDYGNPVLGYSVAALASMDYFLMRKLKHELYFNIGTGLVYTSNPYDKHHNRQNIAISAPLSFAIQSRLGYNVIVNKKIKLTPSVSLIHYSNGAYKMPNMGINVPMISFGASYDLYDEKLKFIKNERELSEIGGFYHILNLSSGIRENAPNDPKYPFLNISFTSGKKLSYTNAIILGVDAFFSSALKYELLKNPSNDPENTNFRRVGATIGHELIMGKLSLINQIGYYLYKPKGFNMHFYQRYGLRYTFKENYVAGMNLKCHLGKAEAIEWSFGFKF